MISCCVLFRCSLKCKHLGRLYTTHPEPKGTLRVGNISFRTDNWTNITPKIISYLGANKHLQKHHPLSIVRQRIVNYFYKSFTNARGNPLFSVFDHQTPIVSTQQNFDTLLIPADHPSRSKTDCYYINKEFLLRAHTTAHQADIMASGLDNFLIVGDVYRRDEIDSTHYPVFHQLDGVRLLRKEKLFVKHPDLDIFEPNPKMNPLVSADSKCIDQSKQPCHTLEAVKLAEHELKWVLSALVKDLFGPEVKQRWVDQYFPFTQPSWELEIHHNGEWMEVLGCGIMRNEILQNGGVLNSIGYAFGLGLERLAMILFGIPDIRLFWSNDSGFLNQFNETNLQVLPKYKPISVYPQCTNDISFWLPFGMELDEFQPNDFYDLVRTVAGDIVEQIRLVDKFKHYKMGKSSMCFRIVYRHMERTLTQAEVNKIHKKISDAAEELLNVKIR